MSILLEHAWAVTMDPAQPVLRDAFVAVEGSRIASVGTVRPAGDFDRVMDCRGKALLPGFVNAHTHLPMTLMRGYGGGHDLQHWLNDYIFPAEDKLDSRSVTAGTQLALAELIAAGVTCVADMYYFCPHIAQAVADSGLSANISRSVTCFAPVDDPADYYACRELRELEQQWNGYDDGRIRVDASVHGEYTSFSAPQMWEYLGRYAADHGLGMQVHVSETCAEHEECKARHGGKTPLQILDDIFRFRMKNLKVLFIHYNTQNKLRTFIMIFKAFLQKIVIKQAKFSYSLHILLVFLLLCQHSYHLQISSVFFLYF